MSAAAAKRLGAQIYDAEVVLVDPKDLALVLEERERREVLLWRVLAQHECNHPRRRCADVNCLGAEIREALAQRKAPRGKR